MSLKDQVWQKLRRVPHPDYSRDIVSFGLVKRVVIGEEGDVTVSLAISHLPQETQTAMATSLQQALTRLPGLRRLRVEVARPVSVQPRTTPPVPVRTGIRYVLAVGSGKGGVGKSTVAVNIAAALAGRGLRVGLMDADVYGPNIPRMLGVDRLPPAQSGKITPAEAHGIRLVSLGLLADSDAAVIWRGPMTDKLVRQFVTDVAWGELDVLVADLPPGTGDIAIALARHTQVNGAVMVVTPQAVAADDARRAVAMFRQFEVPLLGLVENMSYFTCSTCSTPHYLFGQGGGRSLAKILEIPFLGEVPLEPEVGHSGDKGRPAILLPGSQAGATLRDIARKIWEQLEAANNLELSTGPNRLTTPVTN